MFGDDAVVYAFGIAAAYVFSVNEQKTIYASIPYNYICPRIGRGLKIFLKEKKEYEDRMRKRDQEQ